MFPSHLDSGFHIVCQDNELRWSAVVMGAKTHDVDNLTKARPLWMFDNESEYVKEFLDSNRIGELDQIFNQPVGERTEVYRHPDEIRPEPVRGGRHRDRGAIGGGGRPAFSDNPPEPLSLDDQEKVYRKLERRQEILDLLGELQKKRPPKA